MDSFDDNDGSRGNQTRPPERDTLRLDAGRPDPVGSSDDDAEARMRQALGLFGQRAPQADAGGGGRQGGGHMQVGTRRHRFVQDGEVPVSVVRGRRDQVASPASTPRPDTRERLLDEQAAERAGREQAERRLAEAQNSIRTLQTRLGHAELERDEAVGEARSLRERLSAERAAVEELRSLHAETAEAGPEAHEGKKGIAKVGPEPDETAEPEPVKWWL